MDHIAILKKSWNLDAKILSGEKRIESRWYQSRRAPWDRIAPGDTVYFKNSGEPVTLAARVSKVLQFADMTPAIVRKILEEHGGPGGVAVRDIERSFAANRHKRYCILVFLEEARAVSPFAVDKTGYGNMAAWICPEDLNRIKIS